MFDSYSSTTRQQYLESNAAAVDYEVCTEATDRSHWHPKSAALYNYWLSISPPGNLPGRQHFDPLSVAKLLPNIWLLDVVHDPLRFKYRLFGTHLVDFFKIEPTGNFFHEVHATSPNLAASTTRLQRIANEGVVVRSKARVALFADQNFAIVDALHLPMARNGRKVDLLLSISIFTAAASGREI